MRIGVGVLRKPEPKRRSQRFGRYEIVDRGKWTTKRGQGPHRVRPRAEGRPPATPTSIARRCASTGDTLVIEHELKNTGTQADRDQRLQPQLLHARSASRPGRTTWSASRSTPKAARPLERHGRRSRGRELRFARDFGRRRTSSRSWKASAPAASDYDFVMENRATGAGVRIARRSAADEAGLLVGPQDGVPGAVRRRQRRARTRHLVADHLHVLRSQGRHRRDALTSPRARRREHAPAQKWVAAGQF